MSEQTRVIEYKCPCCGAGLRFEGETQKLSCQYCDNAFDLETVRAFNASEAASSSEEMRWDSHQENEWSQEEADHLKLFICPSCGGEIISDENTAATFCPYCDNPTIMPARLSGGLKPDAIVPFQKSKKRCPREQIFPARPLKPQDAPFFAFFLV